MDMKNDYGLLVQNCWSTVYLYDGNDYYEYDEYDEDLKRGLESKCVKTDGT